MHQSDGEKLQLKTIKEKTLKRHFDTCGVDKTLKVTGHGWMDGWMYQTERQTNKQTELAS